MDEQNAAAKPVLVSDVGQMFRRPIKPNMKPYDKARLEYINGIVDEWEENVLQKISHSTPRGPSVKAGAVYEEWNYFRTGKDIEQFIEAYECGHVIRPPPDTVKEWVDFFTNATVDDMNRKGTPLVGYGWKLLVDETFIRSMLDKWDLVYCCVGNNPMKWRKNARTQSLATTQIRFGILNNIRKYSRESEQFLGLKEDHNKYLSYSQCADCSRESYVQKDETCVIFPRIFMEK